MLSVLQSDEGLTAGLVPHVISLLAWNPVVSDAIQALRKVAHKNVGTLVDALIDADEEFAVRRRLARVFSRCESQRAVDGLLLGLSDTRFEVRFQCGRSLAAIVSKHSSLNVDRERALAAVLSEVVVSRPVWEGRRLFDQLDEGDERSFVEDFVKDRASQSLAHVFTLLSLVLPREPLQIAFRGLHTDDENLRGTALEYLESVLPASVRERLWPFLEDSRAAALTARDRDEVMADLLRSNASIMINLRELKQRVGSAPSPPGPRDDESSGDSE